MNTKKRNKASSTPRERLYIYLTKTQKERLTEYTASLGLSNSKYVTKLITKEINKQIQYDEGYDDDPNSILNDDILKQIAGGKILTDEERAAYMTPRELKDYNDFIKEALILKKLKEEGSK